MRAGFVTRYRYFEYLNRTDQTESQQTFQCQFSLWRTEATNFARSALDARGELLRLAFSLLPVCNRPTSTRLEVESWKRLGDALRLLFYFALRAKSVYVFIFLFVLTNMLCQQYSRMLSMYVCVWMPLAAFARTLNSQIQTNRKTKNNRTQHEFKFFAR